MIVADTSVLIDLFRGVSNPPADRLRDLERSGIPVSIPAVCCQEILQGARDQREWDLLLSYLETQPLLVPEETWASHRDAARIFFDCRRAGLTIRSTLDCFVAQLTLENEATLLHNDKDFDRIAEVRPLQIWPGA